MTSRKGPVTEQHQHTETFGRDHREVARARHLVTGLLQRWGLRGEVPTFELAVSELVSNALLHGAGEIQVQLSCDASGSVRLAVADEGWDVPGGAGPHLEERLAGGWGLRFVDRLAERWGTHHDEHGTLVWMVRRATPGPGRAPGPAAGRGVGDRFGRVRRVRRVGRVGRA
ncbi:MAG TPA: ATP-binding protein [Acidimicrobiales bacterium]